MLKRAKLTAAAKRELALANAMGKLMARFTIAKRFGP
jgi:hypothetical protein